jgi:hypothetical protein
MNLRNIRIVVQLSCEEASRLASESLDRELSRSERWGLRFHTLLCRSCHRMLHQLRALHSIVAEMPEAAQQAFRAAQPQLSTDRKQRIKRLLAEARHAEQN